MLRTALDDVFQSGAEQSFDFHVAGTALTAKSTTMNDSRHESCPQGSCSPLGRR